MNLYGLKIYGSPWQPEFGGWAFNVKRGEEILKKWNKIPTDTNILISKFWSIQVNINTIN